MKENKLDNNIIEDLKASIDRDMVGSETNHYENKYLFIMKKANDWIEQAKNRPIPQMLFSEFWFEGELCILYANTNLGKSILAVQIGDSISKGKNVYGFKFEGQPQSVLYFDFELSDKQFEHRYSEDYHNHYSFDNNFTRVEINPDADIPDKQRYEDYLKISLEKCIEESGARIVIIDNITYLSNETEKSRDALPLMKHLKELKTKYNLSILVLAHTPKIDLSKPITVNDLAGSKMLINFCDSAFSIGKSGEDKSIRYLKQIKSRNTEIIYDAKNVIVCQIEKYINFLQFSFVNFGIETDHLMELSKQDRENKIDIAKKLKSEGRTQREISSQLGVSLGTVNGYLK